MTLSAGDFPAFFAANHDGVEPFAWQQRLLDAVLDKGRWPDRIEAPTGAGKTAVIDVHIFAVALMAAAGPKVPRRLALVVDRRALVDSQYDIARALQERLAVARGDDVLADVAARLKSLRSARDADAPPFTVALLRGGVPASRRWVDDPTAAAIICATPAMWGSRLMFRGYGSGRLARPREAGLIAYDAVVMVDEAHLARQLVATARRVGQLEGLASHPVPSPVLQVVETTATQADDTGGTAVGVIPADLDGGSAGSINLSKRLRTPKPVELVSIPDWPATTASARTSVARRLATDVEALLSRHGRTVACITNTVAVALAAATELRHRGLTVELLVGRMRPHDVAALRRRRPGLLTVDGDPAVDVVVATQTIEVGTDVDFSAMVTELAPGSAIAQRAGRVNRLGKREDTMVRVLVPADAIGSKGAPPYGQDDLMAARTWLSGRSAAGSGLAPLALASDPPPPARLPRVVLGRPEPADALLLARTSDDLFAEPDLELWLADDLSRDADVTVVVRAGIGTDTTSDLALLRVTPPRDVEAFPASMATVQALLSDRDEWRRGLYRWRQGELDAIEEPGELRPGDTIVIGDENPWFINDVVDRDGSARVADVLEGGPADAPLVLRVGLHLPIATHCGGTLVTVLLESLGGLLQERPDDGRARRAELASILDDAAAAVSAGDGGVWSERLRAAARLMRGRLADATVDLGPIDHEGNPSWMVVTDQRRRTADDETRQVWTGSGTPISLAQHQSSVGARAREIAERLATGDGLASGLARAGELHDEGKRDTRFQRLLGADPDSGSPLAKSGRRTPAEYRAAKTACGLPDGWRHEQLSAVVAMADETDRDDRDLVVRLVGTSHGHGRSSFGHGSSLLLAADHPHVGIAVDLHDRGDWDALVDRTHRRYGIWGCAYLESLLRAADNQISREDDDHA